MVTAYIVSWCIIGGLWILIVILFIHTAMYDYRTNQIDKERKRNR